MKEFTIAQPLVDAMISHAQSEYPKECCGFLIGPPAEAREFTKLTNVDPDPVMRYTAEPREVKRVHDEIFDRDWEIVSVFHSHTHSPAFPSPTDVQRATYPDAVYTLVSLADRAHPDLRAFRILEGRIEELPVVVTEVAAGESTG